jgi:hypothetical protein
MIKKQFLAWFVNGPNLKSTMTENLFLINKLATNFEKIYFINLCNLSFFGNKKKIQIIYPKDKPINASYFVPQSYFEFKEFLKDKKLIGISNFGKDFEDIKVHLILNLLNIKFIKITNIGNIQWSYFTDVKISTIKKIKFKLSKLYTQKFITFLTIIKMVPKIEIRFLSNNVILENIKKNKLKYLFYKLKLFYAKELILVNSKSYDILLEKNFVPKEDYIVLLDFRFNSPDCKAAGVIYEKKVVDNHYDLLKNLLEKISKKYNKKVIVTIHPADDLEEKKKIFPNYEVVKYKTIETISKAFLVIFFDSSAIVAAILLKKRILSLKSKALPRLADDGSNKYASTVGIYQIMLDGIRDLSIESTILETGKRTSNFDKYIYQHIAPDGKEEGYKKIIRIIKQRFF